MLAAIPERAFIHLLTFAVYSYSCKMQKQFLFSMKSPWEYELEGGSRGLFSAGGLKLPPSQRYCSAASSVWEELNIQVTLPNASAPQMRWSEPAVAKRCLVTPQVVMDYDICWHQKEQNFISKSVP